jgi:hypothetical protein
MGIRKGEGMTGNDQGSSDGDVTPPGAPQEPRDGRRASLRRDAGRWLREALRVIAWRWPRWELLTVRPALVALFYLLPLLLDVIWQRLIISGDAVFCWQGFLSGWSCILLSVLACWIVARDRAADNEAGVSASALITLVGAMNVWSSLLLTLVVGMLVFGMGSWEKLQWPYGHIVAGLPGLWILLAILLMLWRCAVSFKGRAGGVLLAFLALGLIPCFDSGVLWEPRPQTAAEIHAAEIAATDPMVGSFFQPNDEVLAAQPRLIDEALAALQPSVPQRVTVYVVTYVPHGGLSVYKRESEVVAKTMAERFDAGRRTVQLVLNPETTTTLPWATLPNLQRTLESVAEVMDRDKDVLFLHLGSMNASDGRLAVEAGALRLAPLTPEMLKAWLDEAGIRWRVISISACASGGWVAPLAGDGTLVMSATDATSQSPGCQVLEPLTLYGEAMYQEALHKTWSLEQAHALARRQIAAWEAESGRADRRSDPQISGGAGIRDVLARLARERQQTGGKKE